MRGRPRLHDASLTQDQKYGKRDLFFHNSRVRETPNYYYQLYIQRERWRGMDKDRMIHIIKTKILTYGEGKSGNNRGNLSDLQSKETEVILEILTR